MSTPTVEQRIRRVIDDVLHSSDVVAAIERYVRLRYRQTCATTWVPPLGGEQEMHEAGDDVMGAIRDVFASHEDDLRGVGGG
jgi:hypothetical protein